LRRLKTKIIRITARTAHTIMAAKAPGCSDAWLPEPELRSIEVVLAVDSLMEVDLSTIDEVVTEVVGELVVI
jgi:hypothetical protein